MIRIPAPGDLRERLDGTDLLIVARKWERAAIVYAYTEVGLVGAGRWHQPAPPKMNIRTFAAQGYLGLTTNKAVSRYRQAWQTAIDNGWAEPVEPGDLTDVPDQDFPAWPYGDGTTWEDTSTRPKRQPRQPARPYFVRLVERLDSAGSALRQLHAVAIEEPAMRYDVTTRLRRLRDDADAALKALEEVPDDRPDAV